MALLEDIVTILVNLVSGVTPSKDSKMFFDDSAHVMLRWYRPGDLKWV